MPPEITIDTNQKVHFHGFARGVQIYTWDGSSWGPAVPDATLFDEEGEVVATHFADPHMEEQQRQHSCGNSYAAAAPGHSRYEFDSMAIADRGQGGQVWGIFADTTFIHRVNTHGGKAPSVNGT